MTDLESALGAIVGEAGVLTAGSDKEKYLTDWAGANTGAAAAVVRPASTGEVSGVLKWANETKTPVFPQGGNTATSGGGVPDGAGNSIVLSLERMKAVRETSGSARTITVEAGVVLQEIHRLAEEQDLFFPLSLGAQGSCMIGGNLATNAGGINVVRYGNARELCLGLEAVLPDGRVMDVLTGLHKDNTGYDLRDLFIGSEGTLGVITAATLKLFPLPKARATAFAAVPDINRALELLNRMQAETGGAVEAFEMIPKLMMEQYEKHLPHLKRPFADPPDLSVLMEVAATSDREAAAAADGTVPVIGQLETILGEAFETGHVTDAVIATAEQQRLEFWELRESAYEAVVKSGPRIGFDISLPLDQVHDFVANTEAAVEGIFPGAKLSSVGHLGDGNLHYTVYPPDGEADRLEELRVEIKRAVLDSVGGYRGSFSAEHGIGDSKLNEMAAYKDPVAIDVMKSIKAVLDPNGIMNPGRVLPA